MSERKPVGSTRTDKDTVVDLIGDESSTPTIPNGGAAVNGPSTHDLLADIFGSSGSDATPSAPSTAPRQSATTDIMSLFNATSPPMTSPPPSAPPATNPMFDLVSAGASTTTSVAQPPKAQLQTYTAYDQNGLKITLTPKVSPTQPGMVQILARFTSTVQAEGVNFQVAVPKVRRLSRSGSPY